LDERRIQTVSFIRVDERDRSKSELRNDLARSFEAPTVRYESGRRARTFPQRFCLSTAYRFRFGRYERYRFVGKIVSSSARSSRRVQDRLVESKISIRINLVFSRVRKESTRGSAECKNVTSTFPACDCPFRDHDKYRAESVTSTLPDRFSRREKLNRDSPSSPN